MTLLPQRLLPAVGAALLAFTLTACGAATAATSATSVPESQAADWPRTVQVAGQEVTIEAQPRRIVAITTETADLARQVGGAEVDVQALPPTTDPDPEQVLSMTPDLVLSTARHGGEKAAAEQLSATGVPMLNFGPESFNTPEGVAAAIDVLGRALGHEERASELSGELTAAVEEIDADLSGAAPTTLSLMARGNSVMAMDDSVMLAHLVQRAGGVSTASKVGITQTRPIDAELIAVANPDVIFLEDFMGQGSTPFDALLANPALADVRAIANRQVHLIPMDEASALSGTNTPEGYRAIAEIIAQAG